ncbi:MAG: transposase, partial [Oscillospiraceae bacterium]|nr:transposase [Oscillospiraceae bacterium]
MEKRFSYRIYPNKEQEIQIQKNFGCVRFVFNHYLSKRIEKYEAGEGIYGYYESSKDLTQLKKQDEYAWLREADAHSLQNALKNVNFAYSEFYRRIREKDGAPGFPRFKKKKETRQSYTCQAKIGREVIYFDGNKKIRLPKLGLVDCKVSRPIEGRIISASIIQVPSGKYFVSVCCTDIEPEQPVQTGKTIDLQHVYSDERHLEKEQKKISRLHRRMSRKPKGSANYEKARVALAKAYEREKNKKTDKLQKLTTQL